MTESVQRYGNPLVAGKHGLTQAVTMTCRHEHGELVYYNDVKDYLPENNPVLDSPMGPGFYWYQHPDDPQQGRYDPSIIEVGIKGEEFVCKMGGDIVPVEILNGKWQRVVLSSFHKKIEECQTQTKTDNTTTSTVKD